MSDRTRPRSLSEEPRLHTAGELSRRYAVRVRTIYTWVDAGLIRPTYVGRRLVRFTDEAVQEFEKATREGIPGD